MGGSGPPWPPPPLDPPLGRRLVSEGRRPVSEGRRPLSDDGRPMSDDRRPVSDDRRPVGDDRRPVSDDRRPNATKAGLVSAVKGLISRAGMVSICPLLWQRDVTLQQTKLLRPGRRRILRLYYSYMYL